MKKLSISTAMILVLLLAPFLEAAFIAIPDLKIGSKRGNQKGDGLFSSNGDRQVSRVRTKPNGKGKFFFTAQNDETVMGDLRIRASRKNKKFKIRYKQISPAGGNVTAAITSPNGLLLTAVPSGGSVEFKAIAKSGRNFKDRGVKKSFLVTVSDPSDSNLADSGKAKVIKKRN